MPINFSSTNENKLLEYALKTHLDLDVKFNVVGKTRIVESGISARYDFRTIDMVIFNFTDKNLHNTHRTWHLSTPTR